MLNVICYWLVVVGALNYGLMAFGYNFLEKLRTPFDFKIHSPYLEAIPLNEGSDFALLTDTPLGLLVLLFKFIYEAGCILITHLPLPELPPAFYSVFPSGIHF